LGRESGTLGRNTKPESQAPLSRPNPASGFEQDKALDAENIDRQPESYCRNVSRGMEGRQRALESEGEQIRLAFAAHDAFNGLCLTLRVPFRVDTRRTWAGSQYLAVTGAAPVLPECVRPPLHRRCRPP
jgi:hypothetical protein